MPRARLNLPHRLCSRIQNAFRARHAKLAVQHTTTNLGILSILLRTGFISSLTRGTIESPIPSHFDKATTAERRIWADLKYRDDLPVLSQMQLVSKPSKRVFMNLQELRRICSGRSAQSVRPLGMGEVAVVHTNEKEHEWVEAREALLLKLGATVLVLRLSVQFFAPPSIPSFCFSSIQSSSPIRANWGFIREHFRGSNLRLGSVSSNFARDCHDKFTERQQSGQAVQTRYNICEDVHGKLSSREIV